jgi:hypothetical protein
MEEPGDHLIQQLALEQLPIIGGFIGPEDTEGDVGSKMKQFTFKGKDFEYFKMITEINEMLTTSGRDPTKAASRKTKKIQELTYNNLEEICLDASGKCGISFLEGKVDVRYGIVEILDSSR